jgi:tetratricopeptide (TPR) repeat protein
MDDVFAIEDEISENVARAFRVIFRDRGRRALAKVPKSNVRAYEFYLKGRQYLYQIRRKSLGYARDMFRQAIALEPEYALAYAGLADAHASLGTFYPDAGSDLAEADRASRRALELDPELAEAHSARGTALTLMGQDDEAREEFETALRLDPQLWEAHYFFARAHFQRGEFEPPRSRGLVREGLEGRRAAHAAQSRRRSRRHHTLGGTVSHRPYRGGRTMG